MKNPAVTCCPAGENERPKYIHRLLCRYKFPPSAQQLFNAWQLIRLISFQVFIRRRSAFRCRHRSVHSVGLDGLLLSILLRDIAKNEFQVLAFALFVAHG